MSAGTLMESGTPTALARQAAQRYARDKAYREAAKARQARVDRAQRLLDAKIERCPGCDRRVLPMVAGHECVRGPRW